MPIIGAAVAAIEDSPVDGHTAVGISSNWAYDHDADASAHHEKTGLDDDPVNGETAKGITSNWAYDHKADPNAHHAPTNPGEGNILLIPLTHDSIIQGAFQFESAAGYILGSALVNASIADGDGFAYKVFLAAGTYTMLIIGYQHVDRGIWRVKIDDEVVGDYDYYAASPLYNKIYKTTGIVIPQSGIKTISLYVNGKNANSAGYNITFNLIYFYRTA